MKTSLHNHLHTVSHHQAHRIKLHTMKLFSENIFIDFQIVFTSNNCYNISVKKIERMIKMSSKKHRKKLKELKTEKKPSKMFLSDREQVLNYLKTKPYEIVKGQEILDNTNLTYNSIGSLSRTVKAINYYTNECIQTFKGGRGRNGGYMYYEHQ